ncbi:hypothetical protein, partial [Bradyrhizobium sp. 139]|uniref:hypothetical protein n=1 Tax=Bradyrhizobium sp. 139 TaxID=2782616 RepID=UPI001FF84249
MKRRRKSQAEHDGPAQGRQRQDIQQDLKQDIQQGIERGVERLLQARLRAAAGPLVQLDDRFQEICVGTDWVLADSSFAIGAMRSDIMAG